MPPSSSSARFQPSAQVFDALPSLRLVVRVQHAVSELPEIVLMLGEKEADADREEHRQRDPEETRNQSRKCLTSIARFSPGSTADADDSEDDRDEAQKGGNGKEQDEKSEDETDDPANERGDTYAVSKGPMVLGARGLPRGGAHPIFNLLVAGPAPGRVYPRIGAVCLRRNSAKLRTTGVAT